MPESSDASRDADEDPSPERQQSSRGPLVPILVAVAVFLLLTVAALWAASQGGGSVPVPQGAQMSFEAPARG
jgi:hypothetical protein